MADSKKATKSKPKSVPVPTSASEYRERVTRPLVDVGGGLWFRVRTLEFPEYLSILETLKGEFPGRVRDQDMFTIATDMKNPDIMYAFAKHALPMAVIEPRVVAERDDVTGDDDTLAVKELAPADIMRLNMTIMVGKPVITELMASFLEGQSTDSDGSSNSG